MAIEYKTLSIKVPVPRWRYLKFSLRSTLVLIALASIALGWWSDRRRLQQQIDDLNSARRGWGIDQVLGPPNTPTPGDRRSAWASLTPDGQDEWLVLDYEKPVRPTGVEIHETYNPGAVSKVSVFDDVGTEIVVWEGIDPIPPTAAGGVSEIDFEKDVVTRRVKIYLDSMAVQGWNEIDAVGLRYGDGETLWAVQAFASSSYGNNHELWTFSGMSY